MNVNLPVAPAVYNKAWADQMAAAIKNALGPLPAAGATITLPYGASLTLTDAGGRRYAVGVDTTGALVITPQ